MKHVIINFYNCIIILSVFEVCDSVIFINLEHFMEEMSSNVLLLSDLVKFVREFQTVWEHDSYCAVPVNISLVSNIISSKRFL